MKRASWLLHSCSIVLIFITSFISSENTSLSNDVLKQTNQFRRSKGLLPLVIREELNAIAQKHSVNMAKGRTGFGHGGFARRDALARQKIKDVHSFAENVAYGPTTGKEVVEKWKRSPGHRKNMLGRYKYIGIGTAKDRHGRIYYTQVFAG